MVLGAQISYMAVQILDKLLGTIKRLVVAMLYSFTGFLFPSLPFSRPKPSIFWRNNRRWRQVWKRNVERVCVTVAGAFLQFFGQRKHRPRNLSEFIDHFNWYSDILRHTAAS